MAACKDCTAAQFLPPAHRHQPGQQFSLQLWGVCHKLCTLLQPTARFFLQAPACAAPCPFPSKSGSKTHQKAPVELAALFEGYRTSVTAPNTQLQESWLLLFLCHTHFQQDADLPCPQHSMDNEEDIGKTNLSLDTFTAQVTIVKRLL